MSRAVDLRDLKKFNQKVEQIAKTDLKKKYAEWLEGLGLDFLEIVRDEIIAGNNVNTQNLLSGFNRSSGSNIWIFNEGGLSLEVGSNVSYASYLNDGYWECRPNQLKVYIPGLWNGNVFTYMPNADSGMILRRKWIEGSHYWESAVRMMERMYPGRLDALIQQWVKQYF